MDIDKRTVNIMTAAAIGASILISAAAYNRVEQAHLAIARAKQETDLKLGRVDIKVLDLRDKVEYLTHPATMNRRFIEYGHQIGEFAPGRNDIDRGRD
jgi:hypothetical protein